MVRWSDVKKRFCVQQSEAWTLSSVLCRPQKGKFKVSKIGRAVRKVQTKNRRMLTRTVTMGIERR